MGHGVAQIVAQAGFEVVVVETDHVYLDKGFQRIENSLQKFIAKDVLKGKITDAEGKLQYETVMKRITKTTDLSNIASCDLIIEAIAENMDLKVSFYKNLGTIAKPSTIFASNTSSLPITGMAEASGRPDKFVGLHFFNPVQLMKLVEVIKSKHTNPEVFNQVYEFSKVIGKTPVKCQDTPGFIVNRLLVPYLTQALLMVDRNDASIADIDVSMQLGAGHPMGPLHLADYIGLDTILSILEGWQIEHPEEHAFLIPKILREKVKAGNFGRKSGKGFYEWNGDKIGNPL